MALILLVEDDPLIRKLVQEILGRHRTLFAADAESALHLLKVEQPDLILLDLGLPGGVDGALLLGHIREFSDIPIIVLSARSGQIDKVMCLRFGADDFISKPFDIDDLETRVDVVLKRCARVIAEVREKKTYCVGTFSIADQARVNGIPLYLTPTEFRIVTVLARNAGLVVSRAELAHALWGDAGFPNHTIDVHVGRARGRFRRVEGAPELVTVRGKGFTIRAG